MSRRRGIAYRSLLRIVVFVVETATVIVAIRMATGSWASVTVAGATSGALTATTYPALVRRHRRPTGAGGQQRSSSRRPVTGADCDDDAGVPAGCAAAVGWSE